jgi:hypothetical protein
MAQNVLLNGVVYSIPDVGDDNYGQNLTDYFTAIPSAVLQKSGGNFTLTADVNFGANYGLLSAYFSSRTAGKATAGTFRLANTESIGWRNAADSANLLLSVNASNQLTFAGNPLVPSSALSADRAVVTGTGGVLGVSATTAAEIGYVSGVTSGIQAQINAKSPIASPTFTGTVTAPDLILSSLTATTVPYLNGSKQFTSSAVTPTELGYLSGVTSAIQTQINAKAAIAGPTFTGTVTIPTLNVSGLTATTVPYLDGSKNLTSSAVTPTELGRLSGVTSAIQTQLDAKAPLASPTFTGTLAAAAGTFSSTLGVTGVATFSGRVGLANAPGAGALLTLDNSGNQSLMSGTTQIGVANFTAGTSAATSQIDGYRSSPATQAASFTNALMTGYNATGFTKGAGSTITRATNYHGAMPSVGTNNAFLADNAAYTGNWFINQSGSEASKLTGSLTVSGGIVGTTTNDSATAGNVGEYKSAGTSGGSNVSPAASGSYANLCSFTLGAGDWVVEGTGIFATSGTTMTGALAAISTSSAALDASALASGGVNSQPVTSNSYTDNVGVMLPTGRRRISVSGDTTIYLVGRMNYSVLGSAVWSSNSVIKAWRVR